MNESPTVLNSRLWQSMQSTAPHSIDELSNNRQLSVRHAGSGPDVFLLHGIGSGSGSWCHQFSALSASLRLHAWDMPGYGESSRAMRADVDAYATIVDDWLHTLRISSAVIVGHSLGAIIAARLAVQFPDRVRGLFLSDPAAGHARLSERSAEDKYANRLQRFERLGAVRHAQERASAMLSPTTTDESRSLVQTILSHLKQPGYADAAMVLRLGDIVSDLTHIKLKQPSLPIMMVCGEDDTVTPPADVKRLCAVFDPPCRYVGLPRAGHASQIDAAALFNPLLDEFTQACNRDA